jgi:hypothetical protein
MDTMAALHVGVVLQWPCEPLYDYMFKSKIEVKLYKLSYAEYCQRQSLMIVEAGESCLAFKRLHRRCVTKRNEVHSIKLALSAR